MEANSKTITAEDMALIMVLNVTEALKIMAEMRLTSEQVRMMKEAFMYQIIYGAEETIEAAHQNYEELMLQDLN